MPASCTGCRRTLLHVGAAKLRRSQFLVRCGGPAAALASGLLKNGRRLDQRRAESAVSDSVAQHEQRCGEAVDVLRRIRGRERLQLEPTLLLVPLRVGNQSVSTLRTGFQAGLLTLLGDRLTQDDRSRQARGGS